MSDQIKYSNRELAQYLKNRAVEPDALSRLLRNPDGRNGIVHTPREIIQQPFLWRATARMMCDRVDELRSFLARTGLFNERDRPTIVLTGAGTSDYIGQSVSDLLRERFSTPVISWPTTRITANPGSFFAGDNPCLMFHFARSGDSPESRAVLDIALDNYSNRINHVVITCNASGHLAQRAGLQPEQVFLIVLDEACNDQGLAMTSSFSNMVVAAQAFANLDDMDRFVDLINRLAEAAEAFTRETADEIDALVDVDFIRRAFFLGNGDLLGAASESALKVQELTAGKMIAKSDDTLAFRHGPVSAVNGSTLVAFFLSADAYTRRYELDVLNQYQSAFSMLGARTVVLAASADDVSIRDGVTALTYDRDGLYDIPRLYQVNLAVLFGQMLGLFASYKMGHDVDEPTANSGLYARTVQGVQLYDYNDYKRTPARVAGQTAR